jgi:carboxypeptidase C (cathepsin A)
MTWDSVGVGFSYADHGETVETTETAAKNVDAFLRIFFENFKQFSGRRLHLAGESYGVCPVSDELSTFCLISEP